MIAGMSELGYVVATWGISVSLVLGGIYAWKYYRIARDR